MNASSLIGMTVVAIDAGKNLGSVERLVFSFSTQEMRVTGFVLTPGTGLMDDPEAARLLPIGEVRSIGHDAVTVASADALTILTAGELPPGMVASDALEQQRVITEGGEQLGRVAALVVDESDFRLRSLELGGGFLGSSFPVSVRDIVSIGEDGIVVRDAAIARHEISSELPVTDEEREDAQRRDPGLA